MDYKKPTREQMHFMIGVLLGASNSRTNYCDGGLLMGKTPREIIFGPRVNVSMDTNQAGATMSSRYEVAKHGLIIGSAVVPVGAIARGGSTVTGSRAYKVYGAVKRPILTVGVHQGIHGARTAMSLSKMYSKMALVASVLNFGRNVELAYAKEYRRLGINIFGPPGSLFLYDNYMDRNKSSEDTIKSAEKEKSRRDSSLTSKSKTRGKQLSNLPEGYFYTKKKGVPCAPGFKYHRDSGMCIKL